MAIIIIILIIVCIVWYKRSHRKEKEKNISFLIEYPRLQHIINESMEIINKTKNVETAITRYDTIKEMIRRLIEITPISVKLSIEIQGIKIASLSDLVNIDQMKQDWIKEYFKNKIETEIKKTELLSDSKLKANQIKKTLNIALKSFDYLPEDEEIRFIIKNIEDSFISVPSGNNASKVKRLN